MKKLLLVLMLCISFTGFSQYSLQATKYYPGYKGMKTITADGSKINSNKLKNGNIRWVALSRDMLKEFKFGDTIRVESSNSYLNGYWVVKDKMHKRCKRKIDFMLHRNEQINFNKPMKVKIYKK